MLTERRARILQFVVSEYIESATPVGSETVVRKYGIRVSPATIRNEMMRLEEAGYLVQPHTSAGRIPSDLGYRYYVESLMEEEDLDEEMERTIRHQFYQVGRAIEAWAQLAADILARAVGNLALVTAPHPARARLRWLELVSIREGLVLVVAVLHEGSAREETIGLDEPLSQDDLSRIARRLSRLFGGLSAAEIREQAADMPPGEPRPSPFEDEVVDKIIRVLEAEEQLGYEPAYLEGLGNILRQPEFAQREAMLDLLDALDEYSLPRLIPFHWAGPGRLAVIIGGENPQDIMRQCSLVVGRYGRPGGLTGALGVLGPTRLPYPRATSMVRHYG
jgi:heat-inducible transcriptional repressor